MADDTSLRTTTSVLVVDDHRMIAEALRIRLMSTAPPDRAFGPVTTAYSLEMARVALHSSSPELVLLDFRLGQECGLDLFPDISSLETPPVTVILAAGADTGQVIEGLCHAAGWVSKTTPFHGLLTAIDATIAGRTYVSPELLGPVIDELLHEAGRLTAPPTFLDSISPRERQVLRCLVGGMTRQEVASYLFISANTVRTHVQNLLRHAEVHSTLALIAAARDLGVAPIDV